MDLLGKRIYIAGSSGMVGRALTERLQQSGFTSLILQNAHQLDLRRQQLVEDFFASKRPEIVVVAAAKVGGILANNTYRAEFIYDNISIVSNIVNSAYRFGVEKLIYLGSSCIYPRDC